MVAFGGAALWLTWAGSRDARALWLAGVFMTVASAFAYGPASDFRASLGPALDGPSVVERHASSRSSCPSACGASCAPSRACCTSSGRSAVVRAAIGVTAGAGVALFLLNLAIAFGGTRAGPPPRVGRGCASVTSPSSTGA